MKITYVYGRSVIGTPADRLEEALGKLKMEGYRPIHIVSNPHSVLNIIFALLKPLKLYTIISDKD